MSGDEQERAVRRLDAARAVGPAVLTLPAGQQRLVAFVLMCPDASYQEISERLEMPMGSIGPIMGRAFSTLRCELARVGLPVLVVVLVGIQEGTGFDVGAVLV